MARHRRALFGTLLFLVSCAVSVPALCAEQEGGVDALLEEMRSTELRFDEAVQVENLQIELAAARIDFRHGTLIPARAVGGRDIELVFLGSARFHYENADPVEQHQLELFVNAEALDAEVSAAVISLGDPGLMARLFEGRPATLLDVEEEEKARKCFEAWVNGPVTRGLGVDASLLRAALGDPEGQAQYSGWFQSEEVGDFFYRFDPAEVEQIRLGQFVPMDLDSRDRNFYERYVRKQRQSRRMMQSRLADLGWWDTWSQAVARGDSGPQPGHASFEPVHYDLSVEVVKRTMELRGEARVDLRCDREGARVVSASIYPDLQITAVADAAGESLEWNRAGDAIQIVLPGGVSKGEKVALNVKWKGYVLDEVDLGVYRIADTLRWYPRFGGVDLATYDLDIRWPKKHELLAAGALVERSEADGVLRERRNLSIPSLGVSFEIGAYDIVEVQAGHVAIRLGFSKVTQIDRKTREEVATTFAESLIFLEETFGPYPLDHLTVATVPRGYSQGLLGFITLSQWVAELRGNTKTSRNQLYLDARTETIAHELSHQWWGHKIGWASYRDQWLSEALADFSSSLYTKSVRQSKAYYLASNARAWQNALTRRTADGRIIESLGPVTMGQRLFSSISSRAYQSIVYRKGSVVFFMLARGLGEEPLVDALRTLAGAVNHRQISTETFLSALERIMSVDLDGFAENFIYGTGLPEIYYSYEIEEGPEGWVVRGDARQIPQITYRYAMERANGAWRLRQTRVENLETSDWFMLVPFQVELADAENKKVFDKRFETTRSQRGLGGNMLFQGESAEFNIPLDKEPRRFYLDQRGEVLATFICESDRPKQALRWRAESASPLEARALLLRALVAPFYSEQALAFMDDKTRPSEDLIAAWTNRENISIVLSLAESYLDEGDAGPAREMLDKAESLVGKWEKRYAKTRRTVLATRLDLIAGEYKDAFERLREVVWLHFPYKDNETMRDGSRRRRFRQGYLRRGDAYAMLALAAHRIDEPEVAAVALDAADEYGADVDALRAEIESTETAAAR
ncbi:hypothetical protein ABI59_19085 [Acidobacteria bacterium Mor1]|nr:hypothetical protein ABI59_19085 [Acidobacteria bacterium Mor1]